MIKINSLNKVIGVFHMGLIECDLDQAAERLVILNRNTMYIFANRIIGGQSIIKKLVPLSYVNSNDLLIGILDDNGEFNAVFVDGIKPQLVDANTVDLS